MSLELLKVVYPDLNNNADNYDPLLNLYGEVLLVSREDDYQGDSWVLYKNKLNQFGFLQFGWGSCSGCDALQACSTYEDLFDLYQTLKDSIHWENSAQEMITWFEHIHDWDGSFCSDKEVQLAFRQRALQILKEI